MSFINYNRNQNAIVFDSVEKSFHGHTVLDGVSFEIPYGSRFVLYGPSGSGKSTILRLMAGLIEADGGTITGMDGPVSLVFQEDRLFGALSCLENIMYGLDYRKASRQEIEDKARYWADFFACTEYLQQKTSTLSGGQRQRAALARAFMKDPDVVLLDESFNSLDPVLKQELMDQLLLLQKKRRFTLISVTHNYEEAQKLGDQVLLLKNGKVLQKGSPASLYRDPMDLFEARAFGGMTYNILPAAWFGHKGYAGISAYAFRLHPNASLTIHPAAKEQEAKEKSAAQTEACQKEACPTNTGKKEAVQNEACTKEACTKEACQKAEPGKSHPLDQKTELQKTERNQSHTLERNAENSVKEPRIQYDPVSQMWMIPVHLIEALDLGYGYLCRMEYQSESFYAILRTGTPSGWLGFSAQDLNWFDEQGNRISTQKTDC